MIRRLVLLLLALVLPLKALAVASLPIAGLPGHAHKHLHTAHDHAGETPSAQADPQCRAADCGTGEPSESPLHDHACPHLGMASVVTSTSAPRVERLASAPLAPPVMRFSSIALPPPSPPPTTTR